MAREVRLMRLLVVIGCLGAAFAADDSQPQDGSLASKREVLVKEVVFDSAVADIQYLGKKHECILVTTKLKRLYFSEDAGQQWQEITSKIDTAGNTELQVDRVIINPNDKSVAVLQTKRRAVSQPGRLGESSKWWPYTYVSEDSGRHWRKAWGKHHGLHSWISHPKKRDWALVSWWTGDCDHDAYKAKKTPGDEEDEDEKTDRDVCIHRLMITRDLGKNFVQIATYVVQFSWGSVASTQETRVYFTSYRTKEGDQGKLSLWTSEVDFYHADISAGGRPYTPQMAVTYGNKFLVSGEFILVAKVKDEAAQTVNLMVSKDGAKTFKPAMLPSGMGDMEERWYTVLDTSEGAVILHINSNGDGTKDTGRIYISDSEGTKFTQSLVNNVRSAQGECEFDKVVSLQGVYMANVVVPDGDQASSQGLAKDKADAAERVEKEASAGTQNDIKHGRGFGVKAKSSKEERTIRTVISFDKGGAWSYLKPPRVDSLGAAYECAGKPAEECSLHLHGTTSWDFYAPFYSTENSVGIIMGTGNVGPSLRFEPEETDTFLSRDGGLTWMQAHKGAYIYEFGDHGGLIVMADDLKKTTEVVFTWNEGQSWYDFKVSKTPFEVDNILTEPNLTATTFVMFGAREEGVGVLYYMKFDALQFPRCRGIWAADSVSSDYETWTPSDGVNKEACMLGQQITYTRRKRTSACWNGEDFERVVTKKICSCTQEDFACDVGFTREVGSTECRYGGPELMPERYIPAVCSGYFAADAYRKVPGDVCEGGWQPEKAQVPCPSVITPDNLKNVLAVLFVLGAAYMAYTKFCAGGGGKSAQQGLGDFTAKQGLQLGSLSSPKEALASCCGWVQSKVAGHRGIERFPDLTYKKLGAGEFDLDGMGAGNEESLTDFLDEAEHDDFAPPVYDSVAADKRSSHSRPEDGGGSRRPVVVSGGARDATQAVPRLSAPPGGAAAVPSSSFNLGTGDEDLL